MPRCPNCSRETMRTEDWACQWCGYPLLSGAYKKIAKTYKQLKEERLHKPEEIQAHEPEPEAKKEAEIIPEEIPTLLPKSEPEPMPEPEKEIEPIQKSEPKPELESKDEPETRPELESEVATVPELEKEAELEPAVMELTVEELLSAYETDETAADENFVNKVLRVTGVVATIDIKDKLETHYIRLTGAEGNLLQSVQCVFNKKHAPALEQLEKGQTVTVQGTYNGSMIATRMVDCALVL